MDVIWKIQCDGFGVKFVGASFVCVNCKMGQECVDCINSGQPFGDSLVAGLLSFLRYASCLRNAVGSRISPVSVQTSIYNVA